MRRTPIFFVFEVTEECNSSCSFCYNVWKTPGTAYPATPKLSLESRKRIIQNIIKECQATEQPLLGFALAGGEPLMDELFFETVTLLHQKAIPVNLATNGRLLTKETIISLKELGVNRIEVSLPAVQGKQYENLTGSSALSTVRSNILLLKEFHPRVNLTIAITITKENVISVEECMDIAIAFSADSIVLNRFIPGGRAAQTSTQYLPSLDELASILTKANEKSQHYEIPITVALPIEDCLLSHKEFPHLNFGTCTCGESKWVIDPAGNLRICEQEPRVLGNLLHHSFTELASQAMVSQFRKQHRFAHCPECDKVTHCGGGCRFLQ